MQLRWAGECAVLSAFLLISSLCLSIGSAMPVASAETPGSPLQMGREEQEQEFGREREVEQKQQLQTHEHDHDHMGPFTQEQDDDEEVCSEQPGDAEAPVFAGLMKNDGLLDLRMVLLGMLCAGLVRLCRTKYASIEPLVRVLL